MKVDRFYTRNIETEYLLRLQLNVLKSPIVVNTACRLQNRVTAGNDLWRDIPREKL